jgi:urea transport system substrate-binding protein
MADVGVKRWVLEGTDYVYPRTTNKILEAYLLSKGVAPADISINYTPFGHSDWQTRVAEIKRFGSAGKKTAVVSTINGDANVPFYKELGNQKISAEDIPVVAFSVGEEELSGLDAKPLVGHLAAWNYFESISTPANKAFIDQWKAYIKNPKRTTNDPMEAHSSASISGSRRCRRRARPMSRKCWRPFRAGDPEPDRRHREDASESPYHQAGVHRRSQGGRSVRCRLENHRHRAGRRVVGLSPRSKPITADWVTLKCGNYNSTTKVCSGQNYK